MKLGVKITFGIWSSLETSVSKVHDFSTAHNAIVSTIEVATFWKNSLAVYIKSLAHLYSFFLDSVIPILGLYSKVGLSSK